MPSTLVSVEELPSLTATDDILQGGSTAERQFRVKFDGTDVQIADVIYATGLPVRGTAYNGVLYPVTRVPVRDVEDERIWIVTIGYVTPKPTDKKDQGAGVTKYNVTITGNTTPYEESTNVDKSGNVIVNTNGEPLNPPLTRIRYDLQVNVSYYVAAPDWTTLDGCKGCTNSAAVTLTINGVTRTFAINTLKLDSYGFNITVDSKGVSVVQINLTLLYRSDTWQVKVPNMSFYKKVSGELKPIIYDDYMTLTDGNPLKGQPVTEPAYISSSGTVIISGAAYMLSFNIVPTTSFATLLAEIVT